MLAPTPRPSEAHTFEWVIMLMYVNPPLRQVLDSPLVDQGPISLVQEIQRRA